MEITPRHGARVAHVGVRDATELYACRLLLEPRCAYEAVEAMTPAGVAELDGIRAAMETAAGGRARVPAPERGVLPLAGPTLPECAAARVRRADLGQRAALLERVRPGGGLQHRLAGPPHAAARRRSGPATPPPPRRPTTRCSSRRATSWCRPSRTSNELRRRRRRGDRRHGGRPAGPGRPRRAVLRRRPGARRRDERVRADARGTGRAVHGAGPRGRARMRCPKGSARCCWRSSTSTRGPHWRRSLRGSRTTASSSRCRTGSTSR